MVIARVVIMRSANSAKLFHMRKIIKQYASELQCTFMLLNCIFTLRFLVTTSFFQILNLVPYIRRYSLLISTYMYSMKHFGPHQL